MYYPSWKHLSRVLMASWWPVDYRVIVITWKVMPTLRNRVKHLQSILTTIGIDPDRVKDGQRVCCYGIRVYKIDNGIT